MTNKVKFFFADGTNKEFENITNANNMFLYVGKRIASYGNIFKGYFEYPQELSLKKFYETNLLDHEVIRVEFYAEDFLLDFIEKGEDRNIQVSWQVGRFRNGEELIQEEITIDEHFIG